MSTIRLDRLSVSLSGRRVLAEIDLAIGGGEIVGLIGPNRGREIHPDARHGRPADGR